MTAADQRFDGDKDIESLQTIWLQPWCEGCQKHNSADGRQWCEDEVWGECEECGRKPVKYSLAESLADRILQTLDERLMPILTVDEFNMIVAALRAVPSPHDATAADDETTLDLLLREALEPDFEAAAIALGFIKLQTGNWYHPKSDPFFPRRFKSAEEIFDKLAVTADDQRKALREFVGWVDSWVSNPVTSYSVSALDGLFGMTRDKIAALLPTERSNSEDKS